MIINNVFHTASLLLAWTLCDRYLWSVVKVARKRWGGSEFSKGWEKYRGSGGQKSPSGVQGQSPGGGLGAKVETYAKSRTVKTSDKRNTRKTVNKLLLLTFLLSTLRLQTRKTELSWKLEFRYRPQPLALPPSAIGIMSTWLQWLHQWRLLIILSVTQLFQCVWRIGCRYTWHCWVQHVRGLNYDLGGLDTEERGLKTEVGVSPPAPPPLTLTTAYDKRLFKYMTLLLVVILITTLRVTQDDSAFCQYYKLHYIGCVTSRRVCKVWWTRFHVRWTSCMELTQSCSDS